MAIRVGMLWEILVIAVDTLRANKMRSALTILGVVIGVMSIVAMTALIKGFGDSLENQIRAFGSNTVFVQKLGFQSFSSGRSFLELIKRPNLTNEDAKALADSPLVEADRPPVRWRRSLRGDRAHVVRRAGHQAGRGDRRDRELGRTELHPVHGGALLRRLRGPEPPERDRARLLPRRGAVPHARHRPDRQGSPRRPRPLHGDRRDGQAARGARRRQQLRRDSLDDLREALPDAPLPRDALPAR